MWSTVGASLLPQFPYLNSITSDVLALLILGESSANLHHYFPDCLALAEIIDRLRSIAQRIHL